MGLDIKERVLCILPVPEPKELEGFRAKFPGVDIKYIQQRRVNGVFVAIEEGDGTAAVHLDLIS
jgi:phosphoglycerate dehydrogenase-like enzyme